MIKFAYCIVDRKAGLYNNPVFYLRDGQAVRDFQTLCSDRQTMIGRYPEDFALYCVGSFDDETGKFTSLDLPTVIAQGCDFARPQGGQLSGGIPPEDKERSDGKGATAPLPSTDEVRPA